MSERIERFDANGVARLSLRLPTGDARIGTGDPGVVEVSVRGRDTAVDRFVVEQRGDEIVIEPRSGGRRGRWTGVDVDIRIADPIELHARLVSGDVTVGAPLGGLTIDSAAGDVSARAVEGRARVKTASGDVSIESVGDELDVVAVSGDVRVGEAGGHVNAKTASGDISVRIARSSVSANTASGDIEITRFEGETLSANSLSGDVSVGVVSGRRYAVSFQSVSGDVRTDFPVSAGREPGLTTKLGVTTISGDIVVRPAP